MARRSARGAFSQLLDDIIARCSTGRSRRRGICAFDSQEMLLHKRGGRDMRLRFAGNAVAQTGRDNDLIPARCVQESKRRHNRRWQTFGDLTTFSLLVTRICDWMSSDRNPKPMQCQTLPTTGWRARCSGRIPVGLLEDCRCLDELPCRRGVLSLSCRGRLHGVDS